jgi:hypothetical protein
MKKLIKLLIFIQAYGYLGFITYFKQVYWKQDIESKNNGYDIWSFQPLPNYYFKGTIRERNSIFNS